MNFRRFIRWEVEKEEHHFSWFIRWEVEKKEPNFSRFIRWDLFNLFMKLGLDQFEEEEYLI